MTATATDRLTIQGALTREDAIDWAIRRWQDQRMRVITPRESIEVTQLGPRVWRVTAEIEQVRS